MNTSTAKTIKAEPLHSAIRMRSSCVAAYGIVLPLVLIVVALIEFGGIQLFGIDARRISGGDSQRTSGRNAGVHGFGHRVFAGFS